MSRARFVSSANGWDLFERDGVVFGVPTLTEDLSPEIKNALSIRREATIEGRCRCGAVLRMMSTGEVAHAEMSHAEDCPASDEALKAMQQEPRR